MQNGYVYAIGPKRGEGPVKIGFTTKSVSERLKGIQTGNPVKLEVIMYAKCDDVLWFEKVFHGKFRHRRMMGEWFDITREEVIQAFKEQGRESNGETKELSAWKILKMFMKGEI